MMKVINCPIDRRVANQVMIVKNWFQFQALLAAMLIVLVGSRLAEASYIDNSIKSYSAERTCGYNEICKEEFRKIFRCKCPNFLVCRWNQQSWKFFRLRENIFVMSRNKASYERKRFLFVFVMSSDGNFSQFSVKTAPIRLVDRLQANFIFMRK